MGLAKFAAGALLSWAALIGVATAAELPAQTPVLGTDTVHGCYSSLGNLVLNNSHIEFNAQGICAGNCRSMGKPVGAAYSYGCWCGDKYPPLNTLVADSKCDEICPGFSDQACGGLDTYTIYNTGYVVQVANEPNVTSSSSTSASPTTTGVASTANPVVTDTVTPSASATTTSVPSSGSNTSTVGIAVGVVVGVIAVTGVIAGFYFYMRRKRNLEIEEEHRRNAAVNAFINGGKPPSSSGGISMSDSRLDPVMAHRRMSDGSIADNEDYSRRILRVTNA